MHFSTEKFKSFLLAGTFTAFIGYVNRLSDSVIIGHVIGEDALAEQRDPGKDVRDYTDAQLRTPEDARRVPRTLAMMADGTNPPCTKADTQGIRGKDGGDAKSRQLRVVSACEKGVSPLILRRSCRRLSPDRTSSIHGSTLRSLSR